ncbi:MAG: PIG-L family deacetylase [Acidobacteriia bacterium]|nr:PIG-L family deacetylase [Terriglobia bacterium]
MRRLALISAAVLITLSTIPSAQMRVVPIDEEQGHVALGLALRHLSNTGILLHTTAHPDDENNGLLVLLNRGQGYRTALATATRGNGGQNEIGPEIFEALGVLRTQELAALHRFDGAEQYFTRAVDFGFSFSLDETFEKWGRDEITSDYVRLIRMIRPDVVIGLPPAGEGGGQHHQASSIITRDAVKIAGDKTKYPDQIEAGLRPWQPKKFYYLAAFGFPGEAPVQGRALRINLSGYDTLLGKTYQEIGTEARSMHKCQGMAQLLSLPGPATTIYKLAETTIPGQMDRDETSLFDGIDTTIAGLAKFAGARPPKELVDGLAQIAAQVQAAQKRFDTESDQAALAPLVAGLHATRVTRAQLRTLTLDDQARAEIGFRLIQKEREFQQAALLANGVRVEALADDGIVVPGQTAKVDVIVANRGAAEVSVRQVKFDGFDPSSGSGQAGAVCELTPFAGAFFFPGAPRPAPAPAGPPMTSVKKDQVAHCEPTLVIPQHARVSEPYWHREGEAGRYTFDADAPFGRPFRPTDFYVQATFAFAIPGGTEEVIDGLPVEHRYEGNIFSGEKRTELLVVPPFSVRVSPEVAIVPAASIRSTPPPPAPAAAGRGGRGAAPAPGGRGGRGAAPAPAAPAPDGPPSADREIRVTVVNDMPAAADSVVRLEAPQGWTVTPAQQPVKFSRSDESQTVRFQVKPAPTAMVGEYHVKAIVSSGGQTYDRGYQVIEYPHIRRAHVYDAADTKLKVIDVRTPANMTIGYVMGVGDQVPPAIAQLGMKVEMITPDDLAWGNLSRFDAIVTGVRAYERRDDLRANNSRLLEYVFNGGTAIVQYNKFEFNEAQYGPYPAKVSSNRVTDEHAPVQVLETRDPVFTTPNEVGEAAWKNWVQERGLYFLGEKDSRYRDLVALEDPFPYNKGEKTGALVEAIYGRGRWVYVGLNLWRQLPVGTDGAYQLLANLLSLGKTAK